jgi:catechol 2,3-dioxygenase-like lactoylglutathione lyase family enzyme
MPHSSPPALRFVSLFVPDLEDAVARYTAVLGVEPSSHDADAPTPHPYAARGPVVFDLGGPKLALYQCDQRTTHPGDVGIGLLVDGEPDALADRAVERGGRVFYGPTPLPGDGRRCAVLLLPDRHFFEVVGRRRP